MLTQWPVFLVWRSVKRGQLANLNQVQMKQYSPVSVNQAIGVMDSTAKVCMLVSLSGLEIVG